MNRTWGCICPWGEQGVRKWGSVVFPARPRAMLCPEGTRLEAGAREFLCRVPDAARAARRHAAASVPLSGPSPTFLSALLASARRRQGGAAHRDLVVGQGHGNAAGGSSGCSSDCGPGLVLAQRHGRARPASCAALCPSWLSRESWREQTLRLVFRSCAVGRRLLSHVRERGPRAPRKQRGRTVLGAGGALCFRSRLRPYMGVAEISAHLSNLGRTIPGQNTYLISSGMCKLLCINSFTSPFVHLL